jgi:hypothetical protein
VASTPKVRRRGIGRADSCPAAGAILWIRSMEIQSSGWAPCGELFFQLTAVLEQEKDDKGNGHQMDDDEIEFQ